MTLCKKIICYTNQYIIGSKSETPIVLLLIHLEYFCLTYMHIFNLIVTIVLQLNLSLHVTKCFCLPALVSFDLTLMIILSACIDANGNPINNGLEIPTYDPCETCRCSDGHHICTAIPISCAGPPHELCVPVQDEGQCCTEFDCSRGMCMYNTKEVKRENLVSFWPLC